MMTLITCKSILIIEDEIEIRENLKALLELEGYRVFTALHGRDGLEVLRQMPRPCLILLDLLMPVMTGEELLEAMTAEDGLATIPVCVVSGVAEKPKVAKGLPFVKKPIDFEGLLKFVRQYCGSPD
jgi:CheY-like chemotaxis protein